uniref:Uncharacterized protein n=1 Tax=Brassica campestris TaxID=3711 RepID=A0A3P5XYW9_BRACM|nr:unnamed protein product [Brassica rapa]
MKPNGKSPVSFANEEKVMFFKDVSQDPYETQLQLPLKRKYVVDSETLKVCLMCCSMDSDFNLAREGPQGNNNHVTTEVSTIMTISKDRVKPSPTPDSWKLNEIFATGIVLGGYQDVMSVIFFWVIHKTDFCSDKFGVRSIRDNNNELMSAVYLQVSIISQALIFVTRSRSWSFVERPGALLMIAFIATLIAVYANWIFAKVKGIGWGWAAVIWVYSILTYIPQDILKFAIRYILSGKAWVSMFDKRTALTTMSDYGAGERQAEWAREQRTHHGLQTRQERTGVTESCLRSLREIHTFKGHVESVAKLKGLDIDTSGHHYTL